MSFNKGFPCNTCGLVFENSQAQRIHMRASWHVYNLKRRMADLPPISAETYTDNTATNLVSTNSGSSDITFSLVARRSSDEDESARRKTKSDHPVKEKSQACCLFCTEDFGNLKANVEHMSVEHNLFLPEVDHLSSLETIIDYLRTIINEYNECLYCGVTKQSPAGIRRHMRDKGHCMINLEREPELLEFWEFSNSDENGSEDEGATIPWAQEIGVAVRGDLSQGEYTLPSGKVVGSKSKARETRVSRRLASSAKESPSQLTTTTTGNTDSTSHSGTTGARTETRGNTMQNGAVTTRDAVGLIGLSDQQIRSLVTLQRKTQKQQAAVQASTAWAGDKGGIHQRHYKVKMNLRDG